MAIEIKIDCKNGSDAEVIANLVPHLNGIDYQIRVTASDQSELRGKKNPQTPLVDKSESGLRSQPLGTNKRKVLIACADRPDNFYALPEITLASGLSIAQVRSVIVDAIKREELQKRTFDSTHKYKITGRGLARLEQFTNNENVSHIAA